MISGNELSSILQPTALGQKAPNPSVVIKDESIESRSSQHTLPAIDKEFRSVLTDTQSGYVKEIIPT